MTVLARRAFGKPDDGVAGDHFVTCPGCGVRFDLRDLGAVFDHLHDGPETQTTSEPETPGQPSGRLHWLL